MGGKDAGVVEFLGRWWPSNAGFVQRHRPDGLLSRFGSNSHQPFRTLYSLGFREPGFVDFSFQTTGNRPESSGHHRLGPLPQPVLTSMTGVGTMRFRKDLGRPGLIRALAECFGRIDDPVDGRRFSLADHLMSAFAMFSLKYPSLLQFDRDSRRDAIVRGNLRTLFGIAAAPCDSAMRKRLDTVDPRQLRPAFRTLFARLQRGRVLEDYTVFDGHYLISIDGTGYFSSKSVHCDHCCVARRSDGSRTYSHSMLAAVVCHPERREVFPLAPEPIARTDGDTKNDCERNAAARFIDDLRREHPHLKAIVLQDGLASNGPHIARLRRHGLRFILGAKPGDHALLFASLDASPDTRTARFTDADGTRHDFRYLNGAPVNASHPDIRVNVIEYRETVIKRTYIAKHHRGPDDPTHRVEEKQRRFSWVTDLPVDSDSLMPVMRAARSRWRIENETFNTLKNQGYRFEHSFGHGKRHLTTVLAMTMMLAFLTDQIEAASCRVFAAALEARGRLRYLRERTRSYFHDFPVPDWRTLYAALTHGHAPVALNVAGPSGRSPPRRGAPGRA